MDKRQIENLRVRIVSVGFACLAFAVFKPLGIGGLGLMLYPHLIAIWILGVGVCYLTEAIMKYIVGMTATLDRGVDYVIRRNLWFQVINSPLEALMMCAYLHFPMTAIGAPDPLSWKGCVQTVLLLAFCSFAIGLYWRYKFRSRYLTAELEETKKLNAQLKELQYRTEQRAKDAEMTLEVKTTSASDPPTDVTTRSTAIVLTGTTNETVSLQVPNLLYIEAVGNYVKVHHLREGAERSDMLRATSKQMEDELHDYPLVVRCHRAFLINLGQVEQVAYKSGNMQLVMRHCPEIIPVSRSKVSLIKKAILGN